VIEGNQAQTPARVYNGILGGSGTLGDITVFGSGTLAPGASPGQMTCSNLTFEAGAKYVVELKGGTAGTGYDQLNVRGAVDLGGATLVPTLGYNAPSGTTYTIVANDGADAIPSRFNGLPLEGDGLDISGTPFSISYAGGTGNDIMLTQLADTQLPQLNITQAGASAVVLSWQTNFPGYTLYSTTNLAAGAWLPVATPTVITGGENHVTNSTAGAGRLYRLQSP